MSGIYIPGVEMPKRCGECPLSSYPHSPCWKNGGAVDWENRPNWCPLVPVPDHGRLIDADEAIGHLFNGEQCLYCWDEIEDAVDATVTIIPADKEADE